MRCACIDIGSNTTALLVAEVGEDGLKTIGKRRAFTMLGESLKEGHIGPEKIEEVCDSVKVFLSYAHRLGAERISVVATHVVREATDGITLTVVIEQHCGVPVRILDTDEEACFSFMGAVGGRIMPGRPTIVVDSGGGSTEITWCEGDGVTLNTRSFAIGSSSVQREFLITDPPTIGELEAAREFADGTFADFVAPKECGVALAVGGGATTAREVVGGLIDDYSVARVLSLVRSMDSEELAKRLEIEWQRARLLPAGLTILAAIAKKLGLSLEVGMGGLREGVIYELNAA